jgi:iron complex outermembrane recepter protein
MKHAIVCRLQALALISAGGFAPASATAAEPEIDQTVLEEVVVTALRRTESAQDVAVAVTVINGDQLKDKGVTNLDDLQFASPALTISDAALTRSVNIRGIGLASGSPSVTPGVATYVDGIFQPPITTSTAYYDIGSIEVLRGPQGTFVGSSSTGGAIFINSNNPSLDDTTGRVEVSAGNFNSWSAQGVLNLPLGETFAMRFAGNHRSRDTFYRDLGPNDSDAGMIEETSGRIGMLWKPGAFQLLLKAELNDRSTGGYAYRPIPGTVYAPLRSDDIRTLTYDDPENNDERSVQASLELRYEMQSGVVLRSISGYQDKRVNNLYDFDATIQPAPPPGPFPRVTEDQFVGERVWTQELNVISPTEGTFDWIVGAYYQRNRIDVDIEQPSDGFMTDVNIHNSKEGTGVFAQLGYKFNPELKLTVGARYSNFDATQTGSVIIGRGLPFPPFNGTGLQVADLAGAHKDGRPTGKIALDWTPSDDHLVYAFIARGYKPGGFNSITSEFDPETVLDYEVGWKATLLDGHLRTQLGAFWYDYQDFQLDQLNPESGQVQPDNVADATVRGIEAQMQGILGNWGFDVGAAWVDSELAEVSFINQRALPPGTNLPQCAPGQAPGIPPNCFDYTPFYASATGERMLYSPEFTYNAGVDYTFNVSGGTLRPRLNYAYIGTQYTNLLYSPISDRLEARGLLSAQLTYERESWMLEAYGTNLNDKEYVAGQFASNELYGAPCQYGLRFSVGF